MSQSMHPHLPFVTREFGRLLKAEWRNAMRTLRRSSTWVSKAFPQCANCVNGEFVSDNILVLLHSFVDSR